MQCLEYVKFRQVSIDYWFPENSTEKKKCHCYRVKRVRSIRFHERKKGVVEAQRGNDGNLLSLFFSKNFVKVMVSLTKLLNS